jgi:hypothetical protein
MCLLEVYLAGKKVKGEVLIKLIGFAPYWKMN